MTLVLYFAFEIGPTWHPLHITFLLIYSSIYPLTFPKFQLVSKSSLVRLSLIPHTACMLGYDPSSAHLPPSLDVFFLSVEWCCRPSSARRLTPPPPLSSRYSLCTFPHGKCINALKLRRRSETRNSAKMAGELRTAKRSEKCKVKTNNQLFSVLELSDPVPVSASNTTLRRQPD